MCVCGGGGASMCVCVLSYILCVLTYRADWLAWLGVLTIVGSGEGLLWGGGGLSGSSVSSSGSSLMWMGGSVGPAQLTEAGSGMEIEEDGAEEEGGGMPGMAFDEDEGGPVAGRTVLKGCGAKEGGGGGALGCEAAAAAEGGRGGAEGGWWLAEGGRL